ncbi:MAG TPA: hypothetical protein VGB28_04085 [Actinomycetota bacterium]|jgi:predicted PurR-regulated permease PerM
MLIPSVVVLSAATLGILVVMVVALIRQVGRLAGTLSAFQRDLQPVLEGLRRDADRAGERLRSIAERQAQQRKGR